MRTSKFSDDQIIGFLRQTEASMLIKEIARKHGFSDASFCKCLSKYGGMDINQTKRLRELEMENGCTSPVCTTAMERPKAMQRC